MTHGRKPHAQSFRLILLLPALAATWLAASWPAAPAQAQIGPRRLARPALRKGGQEEESLDSVFFPPDRETMQHLARAAELVQDKRYGEAARFLNSILDKPEDSFFQPDRGRATFRSLKQEAQRMIGELGEEGRASYELQYGAEARRLLDEAVAQGSRAKLTEVARKFFHTAAGYEATYLVGLAEMQRGQPLAAALCLERLRGSPGAARLEPTLTVVTAVCWQRAGRAEQAVTMLREVRQAFPDAEFELAGRRTKIFSAAAEAAAWLATAAGPHGAPAALAVAREWTLYRGGAARNAVSEGSSPLLNRRWSVPVADGRDLEEMLDKIYQDNLERGTRVLPGLHPLAARDYVLMRSLTGLVGVDLRTGKRVWASTEKTVDDLIEALPRQPGQNAMPLRTWLERRAWDNAVYGTLSSDGEYVYSIDDPPATGHQPSDELNNVERGQPGQIFFNRQFGAPPVEAAGNELNAYEIASQGKLVWVANVEQAGLTGVFFLGPPLPVGGSLYVLGEAKGEVRLFVLDPRSGVVEWSQQLVITDSNPVEDHLRHAAGAMPSYSDGILVCPTSAGAVVAVDLTTRSLLWGFQYPKSFEGNMAMNRLMQFRFQPMPQMHDNDDHDRWTDASVTLAEGHAIFTPVESSEIFCVSLTDGKLKWQKPHEDGLYVACVNEGKVVVVGSRSVKALRLADGESAWGEAALALPSNSTPSGRGFYNRGRYYLPLSSAEVAAIDLADGRIVARSRSRSGTVPGNLICYHGAVISQGVDRVESFYQLDELRDQVAKALQEHPDDPQALARQGELLLDEGEYVEAVKQLRRSHELAAGPRTRELLVGAMLESLRLDYAGNRQLVPEIEKLADQPAQHTALARLMASGLQKNGELVPAFEAYLKMADLSTSSGDMERVDSALSVRRDRWVRARLAELQESATPDQRRQIDALLEKAYAACLDGDDAGRLKNFVLYFGYHPLADQAREQLAGRAMEGKGTVAAHDWLEAEHWLRQLERSADAARSRAAAARLARLCATAERWSDAAVYYRRLTGEWADAVCLDGKTGREFAAELPGQEQLHAAANDADPWPKGKVMVHKEDGQGMNQGRATLVEFRGSPGPFYQYATVEVETSMQHQLIGRDGLGHELWRLPLRDRNDPNNFGFNPAINYVRADGHLLLVSLGYQVVAIDTLGAPGSRANILWRQDLSEAVAGLPRHVGINMQAAAMPWGGGQRLQAVDSNGRPLGNTSPLSSDCVCFQRMRNLIAVDPLTKSTLWTRQDVPSGSELFGDDELLFVVPAAPANATEAMVFRTLDGESLGRRDVPPADQRIFTIGRLVLAWELTGESEGTLRLFDAWKQVDLWRKPFDARARFWPVADEALAAMDTRGRLTVLSLPDGKPTIETQLDKEPALQDIYLLRSPHTDVLITNRSTQQRANINVAAMAVPPGMAAVVNGAAYGFDRRTGQRLYKQTLTQKGLLLGQPAASPLLVFAATTQRMRNNNAQPMKGELTCLDKRTGKIVLQQELDQALNMLETSCRPDKLEVMVRTPVQTFHIKLTDEPAEVPPAEAPPGEKKTSAVGGAGRALSRALGRALTEPDKEGGK
ncbi:MAG TPA: PQQ-binding-like beta-propeller repeat protein [Pirellulales bacterium]